MRWTPSQIEMLKVSYPDVTVSYEIMTSRLEKTRKAIEQKAARIGLARGRTSRPRKPEVRRTYDMIWYHRNRTRVLKRKKERIRAFRIKLKMEFGGRCSKCGYRKSLAALQFHHPNDDKTDLVSRLIGNGKFTEARKEAKKCVLICANCHAEVTFEDYGNVTQ